MRSPARPIARRTVAAAPLALVTSVALLGACASGRAATGTSTGASTGASTVAAAGATAAAGGAQMAGPLSADGAGDTASVRALVSRLDLERYKATIKGLTQFGDRRQGTDRNRAAVDWIEAQLRSYGCSNTERITYDYQLPAPRPAGSPPPAPRIVARARWRLHRPRGHKRTNACDLLFVLRRNRLQRVLVP